MMGDMAGFAEQTSLRIVSQLLFYSETLDRVGATTRHDQPPMVVA